MKIRIFSLIAVLLLLTGTFAWSQDVKGTILGQIADPSGAVLPGAKVVVTNPAMGTKVTLTTNNEGRYMATALTPGIYSIEVTASGFKKVVRNDVELRVADRLDVSLMMEIGAQDQFVTSAAQQ